VKSAVVAKDLRGNDPEELRRTVRKLEEDLFKHRLKKNTNQLENTMLIRNTRRDIARVNTVLAERVRAGGGAAAAKPTSDEASAKDESKSAKPAKGTKPATKSATKSAAKSEAKSAPKPAKAAASEKET
jgi:large subunit ribosomal protein L29